MENREQEIRQDREDLIEGRNAVAEAIRAGILALPLSASASRELPVGELHAVVVR